MIGLKRDGQGRTKGRVWPAGHSQARLQPKGELFQVMRKFSFFSLVSYVGDCHTHTYTMSQQRKKEERSESCPGFSCSGKSCQDSYDL